MEIRIVKIILMIVLGMSAISCSFLIVMSGKKYIGEVLNMVEQVMKEQMEVFIVRISNSAN